jgi:hypothetical protein
MLQKIFSTVILCLSFSIITKAQSASSETTTETPVALSGDEPEDPKPVLTITGSADAFLRYDFNKQLSNNKTSFTNSQNAFSLGMASVKFEHSSSKVNVVADLGFGTRAAEFSYNDAGIMAAVKQLYVSYAPADGLKLTAGTWATHVGYELVDPQLNRNYSMSYMFTNGPFTHTGLKAEYAKGKSGFMIGISNPTDFRIMPSGQINRKFALAQYSYAATDAVKFYFNYVGGKNIDTSIINQFDVVATATVSKTFSIGLNGTLNRSKAWDGVEKKNLEGQNWWGLAGYFNLDPSSAFGLTLRSEYFNDIKFVKGFGTSLLANTLSANFKLGALTFIPELRYESAGQEIYTDADGAGSKSTLSFIFGAVYKF